MQKHWNRESWALLVSSLRSWIWTTVSLRPCKESKWEEDLDQYCNSVKISPNLLECSLITRACLLLISAGFDAGFI